MHADAAIATRTASTRPRVGQSVASLMSEQPALLGAYSARRRRRASSSRAVFTSSGSTPTASDITPRTAASTDVRHCGDDRRRRAAKSAPLVAPRVARPSQSGARMRSFWITCGIILSLGASPAVAQPVSEVPTPSSTVKRAPPFKAGDTVEVYGNWWGPLQWNVSVIIEVKDGQYRIHYGGGRYNTAWVTEDKIRNEVKEKAEQGQRDLQVAFWKDAARFDEDVHMFVGFVMSPDQEITYTLSGADAIKSTLEHLGELDALCKSRYADLRDTETVWKDDYKKLPGTWCKTAARRQEIAVKYASIAAGQRMAERRKWMTKLSDSYSVHDVHVAAGSWYAMLYPPGHDKVKGIIKTTELDDILDHGGETTLAKIRADVGAYFAVTGAKEDAATLAFYDEMKKGLAELKGKVEASLPVSVFVAKGKDAAMQKAGAQGISGKIVKNAVLSPKWVVTTDALKRPVDRVKIGSIVYQAGARCVYRSYAWKQLAKGKSWDAGSVTESTEYYQRCK
jgi:hypothetical protein